LARGPVEDALEAVYGGVTAVADGPRGADLMMLPSRCAGWTAGDVLFHQLLDARRALRTFASPAPGPPDVDDIEYWRAFSPQAGGPGAPGSPEAMEHARYVRISAAAYPPGTLAWDGRGAPAGCRSPRQTARPSARWPAASRCSANCPG
jgi:Mycothiol maleylpyruvate isomerase N-terminal domain